MTTKLRNCSKCSKFSRNKMGEYQRKDGSAGYINQEEDETSPVCTDCRDKEEQLSERDQIIRDNGFTADK